VRGEIKQQYNTEESAHLIQCTVLCPWCISGLGHFNKVNEIGTYGTKATSCGKFIRMSDDVPL